MVVKKLIGIVPFRGGGADSQDSGLDVCTCVNLCKCVTVTSLLIAHYLGLQNGHSQWIILDSCAGGNIRDLPKGLLDGVLTQGFRYLQNRMEQPK